MSNILTKINDSHSSCDSFFEVLHEWLEYITSVDRQPKIDEGTTYLKRELEYTLLNIIAC